MSVAVHIAIALGAVQPRWPVERFWALPFALELWHCRIMVRRPSARRLCRGWRRRLEAQERTPTYWPCVYICDHTGGTLAYGLPLYGRWTSACQPIVCIRLGATSSVLQQPCVLPLLWKYAHYTLVVLEVLTAPVGSWHQVWLEHFRWIALSGGAWVDAWARGCRFKWWKGRLVERLDDPSDEHRAGSDGGVGAGMTQPDHSTSSYSALAKAGLPPNTCSEGNMTWRTVEPFND